ncbi:MAG: glycosyltransferase [Bacteroidota bacterium]
MPPTAPTFAAGLRPASVIIPTLNEVRLIEPLLTRLRGTCDRLGLGLVVTDGGSTDGTLAIARRLADQVVVHPGQDRQTIAAGRNAGAAVAQGRVLLFFNADVTLPSDLDAFLVELIAAADRAGAATCRVAVAPGEARLDDRVVLGACNALFAAMNRVGLGMGRGECHAVRRDTFDAVGGYREDYAAGEDFDLYHRIAARQRAAGGPRVAFLWHRVVHEDPRRYRARGYARTMLDWFRNTVSVTFRNRSFSQEWESVR